MSQFKIKALLLLFTGIFFNSCNLDIIERHYVDYDDAIRNEFTGNGYIPDMFFKKSIKEIRTIQNLDSNEALIRFQITDTLEWNELISELKRCDFKFEKPKTFEMPNWWNANADKDNRFCFTDKNGHKYNFIVDTKKKLIYSWN
jgi:hypothetical protein